MGGRSFAMVPLFFFLTEEMAKRRFICRNVPTHPKTGKGIKEA